MSCNFLLYTKCGSIKAVYFSNGTNFYDITLYGMFSNYRNYHNCDTEILDRINASKVKDMDSNGNYVHTKFNKIC